jgi:hypothetical protein
MAWSDEQAMAGPCARTADGLLQTLHLRNAYAAPTLPWPATPASRPPAVLDVLCGLYGGVQHGVCVPAVQDGGGRRQVAAVCGHRGVARGHGRRLHESPRHVRQEPAVLPAGGYAGERVHRAAAVQRRRGAGKGEREHWHCGTCGAMCEIEDHYWQAGHAMRCCFGSEGLYLRAGHAMRCRFGSDAKPAKSARHVHGLCANQHPRLPLTWCRDRAGGKQGRQTRENHSTW